MKNVLKHNFYLLLLFSLIIMTSCENATIINNKTNESVVSSVDKVSSDETSSQMEIVSIDGYRNLDKSSYIEVTYNKEIEDKFDATAYIKIDPDVNFYVSKVNNKLLIRGDFDSSKNYKLLVLSGVRAIDGSVSKEEKTEDILFDQKKPKLMFSNDGIILPSINDKRIYFRSINVKKVNVVVRKVYSNNTTQFLQSFSFQGNGYFDGDDYYDDEFDYGDDFGYYNKFYSVGDKVYDSDFAIDYKLDTWVQSAVDLSSVIDANGIYQVFIKFDEDGSTYKFTHNDEGNLNWEDRRYIRNNGRLQKTIILTDIGIIANKSEEGIKVNVLDIIDNKALKGLKAYLISRSNQVLEEKTTDSDGVVNFGNYKNSFYVLVDSKESKSILPLRNSLNTNGFAVDGAYVSNGINGYIYTERGVYRPGDQVFVSIIARNNNEPLLDGQPINITVYDPTGVKYIENDTIKDGKNGFYAYNFKTDVSAKTGLWKVEVNIGNEVFVKDISVETVVPNNIKVQLNIPDDAKMSDEASDWSISANYLFGEPAKNLKYNLNFDIREEPVSFEKYKDYAFTVPSSYGFYDSKFLNGTLDSSGYSEISPDFSDLSFSSLNMLVDVTANVISDGGRNITARKYFKLKKFDTYIGIENTDTYRKPGSTLNLKAICVTEDGNELVSGKTLKYRIYSNNHYWWWDYSDYNDFVRSFKSDKNTTLIEEGEFVTSDVPTLLNNTLPDAENIYVEIEDETTGQVTAVSLQSSEWIDSSITKKVETLNLSLDKNKYKVGDVAKVNYKSVIGSKAIITLEKNGKIINQFYKDTDNTNMSFDLSITKDMAPNIYVYISLIQDYKTKDNDRPLRLYGIVPVIVEDDDTKIDLSVDAPEQIRPNEKFTVKIKNNKNYKVDYTIAVVDEGLLDITAFKTPSPWEHFFKKLASKIMMYDNFSEVIEMPYGEINQVLKVGGDEGLIDELARKRRLKELGLEDAERFDPVSLYKGILTTDENGEASVDFEMPNYMGQVRIMVVAANDNSYGSVEKNMLVKAPIILEPTIPRTLKTNDKISVPVSVFAIDEVGSEAEVYFTFGSNKQSKKVPLKKGDKQIVYFDEQVGNEIGKSNITVGVKSSTYNYENTVSIAVNSNNPVIEVSKNDELNGKQTIEYTQDSDYVKGTVDSYIIVSNKMLLGIDNRLNELIRYPYGCAEQTTSSVFPQLFIDKLSTSKEYNKKDIVDNINASISRLKLFQLSNGAFSYWPGDNRISEWTTNYIGHFLIYAKKNGYYIPDSMYDKWLDYTMTKVRGTNIVSDHDIEWKNYALYLLALSGNQNISEMNYMFENFYNDRMSDSSKMYLAAAYKLVGQDNTANSISSNINMDSIKKSYEELNKKDRNYYDYSFGSEIREIAVYLDCYYTINGKRDDDAFNEILNSMRTNNWMSTQTTAYALIALSNASNSNNNSDEIKGSIEIDGKKTEYKTNNQYTLKIDEGSKSIKVSPGSEGMTYVNYYFESIPLNNTVSDYSDGFAIERKFYDNEGKTIDAKNTKSGEKFWMEVLINPKSSNINEVDNMVINQIIPSGWEIDNLRVTDSKMPKWIEDKTKDVEVSYLDIRDDRVMWFFDYKGNKSCSFFIKVNAVTKGEYDFPGTTLEAMYDNNFKAYKKGYKVKVN